MRLSEKGVSFSFFDTIDKRIFITKRKQKKSKCGIIDRKINQEKIILSRFLRFLLDLNESINYFLLCPFAFFATDSRKQTINVKFETQNCQAKYSLFGKECRQNAKKEYV